LFSGGEEIKISWSTVIHRIIARIANLIEQKKTPILLHSKKHRGGISLIFD
jgi:hypothetical protein